MNGQSQALSVISNNIANLSTTGFKRSESVFQTLVSADYQSDAAMGNGAGPLSSQSDLGGIQTSVINRIADQGTIEATGQPLDIAIDGAGLLVYRQGLATTAPMVFGRNGQLGRLAGAEITATDASGQTVTTNEAYLVDVNGNYLQGWPVRSDGSFASDLASLTPIRVDAYSSISQARATSTASLDMNLPASDTVGATESLGLPFYDSTGTLRSLTATFTKTANNTWGVQFTGATGDQVSVSPNQAITFGSNGLVVSPTGYSLAITHADGTTSAFALDISQSTQFASSFNTRGYDYDGHESGSLESVEFDRNGYLLGHFTNGAIEQLYRLPLATFPNVEGLTALEGNVYAASDVSGTFTLNGVGEGAAGSLVPGSLEASNVEMEDQFSRMIMTQQAYNSSATAFRTMDEVLQTARDLKR